MRAYALLNEARDIARGGDVALAIEAFNRALEINPSLDVDPDADARKLAAEHYFERGEQLHYSSEPSKAAAAFRTAFDLDPEVRVWPEMLNEVCWQGVKQDVPQDVLWLCELAVMHEPENGSFRDSRGVARALTGDIEGAVEDFEAFVTWGPEQGRSTEAIMARTRWIAGLRAGQKPVNFAGLEELGRSE